MKCPTDGATLVMADRNGVEIDYCPTCRGVWLDRGELDKIIERSVPSGASQGATPHREAESYRSEPRKKKRSSFLEDIFDF